MSWGEIGFVAGLPSAVTRELLNVSELRTYRDAETVFTQGGAMPGMLVVVEGGLKVFQTDGRGKVQVVDFLPVGACAGVEEAFGEGMAYSGAQALGHTECWLIPRVQTAAPGGPKPHGDRLGQPVPGRQNPPTHCLVGDHQPPEHPRTGRPSHFGIPGAQPPPQPGGIRRDAGGFGPACRYQSEGLQPCASSARRLGPYQEYVSGGADPRCPKVA